MALPVNIPELIHGKIVEWERLEFKRGWNPEDTLHTICAFANDINNWGGGYIIVGVDAVQGVPQLPPAGLPLHLLDKIQGDLIQTCYTIQPNYLPISQPYEIAGKHILVIWCPAGDMRPYSCPSTQGADARRQYYIRAGSRSIIAQGNNQVRLIELTAKIPFDDRIHQEAKLNDLELGLMREFLQEVGSDLFDESTTMPLPELCRVMQIARGPVEMLRPVNVGLMFFNKAPHRFFKRAWIELAIHKDDSGRNYELKNFKGPLHKQLRDCLAFLKAEVLKTTLTKVSGQAESITIVNYPYNALEEALSNAVYHKSYEEDKPVEVQVLTDRMEILSYPGPLPPVTNLELQQRRVIARNYRNRRIGDFLKELNLTEGKATGFPLIIDAMKANGSPAPVFYTDDERTLFLVTLPCHPKLIVTKSVSKLTTSEIDDLLSYNVDNLLIAKILDHDLSDVRDYVRTQIVSKSVSKSVTKSVTKLIDIIDFLSQEKSRQEILNHIGISNQSKNYKEYIWPFIKAGIIEMTIPDKPNSQHQKYRLTEKGKQLIKK
jgi:ATP-dependent DNA helicase RecG